MQLTISEEQRAEIEAGLKLQRKALDKNKSNNEDLGNFAGAQEADRRLHILSGGPGGETGLLEMVYRESKDQGALFERKDEQPDEAQAAGTQSVDEALDDPTFEKAEQPEPEASDETPATPFDEDDDEDDQQEDEAEAGSEGADITPDEEPETDPTTDPGTGLTTPPAEATPLTDTKLRESPTTLSILAREGIEDTRQLYDRRDECPGLKGIGPATMEIIDAVLAEPAGAGDGVAAQEEADDDVEAALDWEPEPEPEDTVVHRWEDEDGQWHETILQINTVRTDTGHAFLEDPEDTDAGIIAKVEVAALEWSTVHDAWTAAVISRIKPHQALQAPADAEMPV